jgi:hypothetical protein
MSEAARPLDDAACALYVHLSDDGGILLVWGDGRSGWVIESKLEAELVRLRESGGRLIYSRDSADQDPPAYVEATFKKIVDSRPPAIQLLPEPHPSARTHREKGFPWLAMAAYRGWRDFIVDLIRRGVPLEAKSSKDGYTALMMAANGGQEEAVRMLVEAGAEVNAKDKHGNSPVMFAAQHGHDNIVRLLLDRGADRSVRGTHGKSAADLAREKGHESTVRLLEGG